jgi:hypothetical protein
MYLINRKINHYSPALTSHELLTQGLMAKTSIEKLAPLGLFAFLKLERS